MFPIDLCFQLTYASNWLALDPAHYVHWSCNLIVMKNSFLPFKWNVKIVASHSGLKSERQHLSEIILAFEIIAYTEPVPTRALYRACKSWLSIIIMNYFSILSHCDFSSGYFLLMKGEKLKVSGAERWANLYVYLRSGRNFGPGLIFFYQTPGIPFRVVRFVFLKCLKHWWNQPCYAIFWKKTFVF